MAQTHAEALNKPSSSGNWLSQDMGRKGLVVGIWSKFLGQLQSSPKIQYTEVSASAAKERLKVALTYDRNGLEQGAVESLREEIVRLMADHLDVQTEDVEVNIDESTGPNRLVASIALRPPRRTRPTAAATQAD